MTPKLKISHCLIDRLSVIKEKCFGCLYGIIYGNSLLVLGFVSEHNTNDLNIQDSFPGEIDLCGIIGIGEDEYSSSRAKKLLQDVDVTDNPLFLTYKIGNRSELIANFIVHGKAEVTTFEIYQDVDIWSEFITIRLQANLPFTCNFQTDLFQDASSTLRKQLASGQVAFHFPSTNVYLMGSDSESGLTGLTGEPEVGELCDVSGDIKEGCSNTKIKKKNKNLDMSTLKAVMFRKATKDVLDGNKNHAPIVDVNKRIYECLTIPLQIDAVAMVHRNTKVLNLYEILIECLCRNLRLLEKCILKQMNDDKDVNILAVSLPEPFHFMPSMCGHFITRFYPKNYDESQLESDRKALHDSFLLPKKWPCFKRTNAFIFKNELPSNGPLINPHEYLTNSPNTDSECCVIRGKYSYYHYMQQDFDDNGWGCAYRSLQTLFSWFRWQGYTEKLVPTHREIQTCLVDIQDKPASFIGSRQWIGSTEVSFCLDTMLGVQCRILHASSGEELGSKGPELVAHFKSQGTPIMVGGGQLAHTIIGIDYDQTSGNIKFLVLDPHYTGGEDIQTITGKGWCGWKPTSFWNKTSYYNLCLPQVPSCY